MNDREATGGPVANQSTARSLGAIARALGLLLYTLSGLAAIGFAYVGATRSHFYNDDMLSLFYLRQDGPIAFLVHPVNVQLVPLHRALTAMLDALCRYDYASHVAVLLALHLCGLWLLRRVLVRLVGDGLFPALLLLVYAAYPFVGVQFIWFSAGLHRFPYLLLTWWSFDHWLSFRQQSGQRHLVAIGVATLVATGFYAKGVLIPVHVAGLELCLWLWTPRVARREHARALAPLVLAAVVLGVVLKLYTQAEFGGERANVLGQIAIQFAAWKTFLKAFIGSVQPSLLGTRGWDPAAWLASALLFGLVAASLARKPERALIWAVALATVVGNVAVLALSNRGAVWGTFMAESHRYYLDQLGVVLPMVALAFVEPSDRPVPTSVAGAGLVGAAVTITALSLLNGLTFLSLLSTRYESHLATRRFVDTFEADLTRLRAMYGPADITLQNELMPTPMLGMTLEYRSVAHMVQAMGKDVDVRQRGRFLVEDDGHIVDKPADYDPRRRQKALVRKHDERVKRLRQWRRTAKPPQ